MFCHFDERDVVRHPLVRDIIGAYAEAERQTEQNAHVQGAPASATRPARPSRTPAHGERPAVSESKPPPPKLKGEAE